MADKILIIDDSTSMREMIKFALTEEGYTVVEASNGQEGLNKLSSEKDFTLVITDIHMDVMNGLEFIKEVRAGSVQKYVPIIVLTTESKDDMQQQAVSMGASAWIVKPFSPDELIAVVKKITG